MFRLRAGGWRVVDRYMMASLPISILIASPFCGCFAHQILCRDSTMSTSSQYPPSPHLLSLVTPLNIILAIGTYFTCCVIYQLIYYRFFHPLRAFPGPFWASVTRLWIAYHNIKADECELELSLHRKYGSVLRITPTLLLVSDATKLPDVYNRQANKSNHYITGSFGETESLFNMREHKGRRIIFIELSWVAHFEA